ncbi:thrombospondin type-1 domain-containing protein 4-like [Condylostylus longicornis]|uniref:thrombospondin type-1 domain-containing protein 4-like n=1 Tax=Condylostylus longicornis TaxID=2530218 RepID=UPI00244DE0EE|nr:thrombospondin type-1 domain-containing protein 4-like [Condylostylus longicornis]XP_055372200.1 thrombospondin type-1 domain-containing protein 4-like [Condylostylus longicornis]
MLHFQDIYFYLTILLVWAVHSSGSIRSVTTNDSPFQCGSVLCRPIFETFKKKHIPHGFLYLTTISAGASNISVMQMDHSKNLLVLKSTEDHHFILNGNDDPSANGIYKYHGNLFEYRRGDDYELIQATGPISKAIDLMINVKGPNPGIQYEYFLPVASGSVSGDDEAATSWNEQGSPLDYSDEAKSDDSTSASPVDRKRKKFMWKLIGFGPCSKTCGGGLQPPIFRCIRDSPTRFYSPRRCMHMEKPTFNEIIYKCNTQPCPAYWHTEEWDDCLCRLGKGVHSREVKCVQELHGGVAIQVDDEACVADDKPSSKEYCSCPKRKITARSNKPSIYEHLHGVTNTIQLNPNHYNNSIHSTTINKLKRGTQKKFRDDPNDRSGMWLMSDWNQKCSADCSYADGIDGFEHRSIFCDRTPPYTERCDLRTTPDTSRPCQNQEICSYGNWYTGKWSKCHGDCFNLMRRRGVLCIKNNGIVDDEECEYDKRPLDREPCQINDVDYCNAKWHYSEWTECSHPCGGGSQKRFVKCLEIDQKENILRESHKCRYSDREPVVSTCNNQKCYKENEEQNNINDDTNSQTNELTASECTDIFPNCHLIANREKYCTLNYYKKYCCKSCESFNNYV